MCPKLLPTLIAVVMTGLACDSPPPFGRLVDHDQRVGAISKPASLLLRSPEESSDREGGASLLPTTTIDHDTRYVLAAYPHKVIALRDPASVTSPGVITFKRSMAGFFPGAENLLIDARVLVLGDNEWDIRPPVLRALEGLGEDRILELELSVKEVPADTPIHLWIEAYQAPPAGGTLYLSSPRSIPQGSRLEFAFGILDAAALQGPVRFSISACDRSACEPLFAETFEPGQEHRSEWQERRISLSPVWGKTRSLKFEAVPEREDALSLPVWANPVVASEPPKPSRPNVILISVDTLRRDHLTVYGYERETTPFISSHIAENGAVFENLIAEAGTTEVSHMSLFTSLPALVHGVTSFGKKLGVPVVTLAEAFRDQGFDTAAFTEGGPLVPEFGFDIGFDRWKENPSLYFLFPTGQVDRIFSQAWDWILERRDRPYFLFLHTFQVHKPLSPPYSYLEYFLEKDEEITEEFEQIARYDQEIRYVDDQLALFWTKMENRGLAQNTILVITSDHGDEFWEHGERGHGLMPWEEILAVPFVMIGPTIAPGTRSKQPLHHIDVMPTLLDLAGIPAPDHMLGLSFADTARGKAAPRQAASRVRTSAVWAAPEGVSFPIFTIRNQNLKVIKIRRGKKVEVECFDLENDPGERTNLCAYGPTPEARRLLAHLSTYKSEMWTTLLSLGGGPRKSPEDGGKGVSVSPEQEAQLRALGYID